MAVRLVHFSNRLAVAREFISNVVLVNALVRSVSHTVLTIDGMCLSLSTLLVQFSIPSELLSQKLFLGISFFNFVLTSSSQTLVVIEYCGADCLFGTVLANNVFVNTLLQVSRIELGHAKVGFVEHRSSARIERGVVAPCESGVEVWGAPRRLDWETGR